MLNRIAFWSTTVFTWIALQPIAWSQERPPVPNPLVECIDPLTMAETVLAEGWAQSLPSSEQALTESKAVFRSIVQNPDLFRQKMTTFRQTHPAGTPGGLALTYPELRPIFVYMYTRAQEAASEIPSRERRIHAALAALQSLIRTALANSLPMGELVRASSDYADFMTVIHHYHFNGRGAALTVLNRYLNPDLALRRDGVYHYVTHSLGINVNGVTEGNFLNVLDQTDIVALPIPFAISEKSLNTLFVRAIAPVGFPDRDMTLEPNRSITSNAASFAIHDYSHIFEYLKRTASVIEAENPLSIVWSQSINWPVYLELVRRVNALTPDDMVSLGLQAGDLQTFLKVVDLVLFFDIHELNYHFVIAPNVFRFAVDSAWSFPQERLDRLGPRQQTIYPIAERWYNSFIQEQY